MKVNKKKLAEIFNVDPRTIERWQSQGLSCVSGGSKGVESVFDTAMAIQWYAQREADIENEKLRKETEDLRAAAESDLQPGTIDYERYRLTKAQADAQELKNAREEGLVLETELFTFILQRVAQEISGILVRVPLTLQRKYCLFIENGQSGQPQSLIVRYSRECRCTCAYSWYWCAPASGCYRCSCPFFQYWFTRTHHHR